MKKAVEKVNKHNLNGRPLKVKEVGPRGGKLSDAQTKAVLVDLADSLFCASL